AGFIYNVKYEILYCRNGERTATSETIEHVAVGIFARKIIPDLIVWDAVIVIVPNNIIVVDGSSQRLRIILFYICYL
ncbi:MAG: hypothetical protein PV354_10530, partial [Bartonella sp.]|nr:hypothetical protein [Bartonella sp.]